MRIQYPKEIDRMMDSIEEYLIFNGHECVVAENAPEGTQEKLDTIRAKMEQFRKQIGVEPPDERNV